MQSIRASGATTVSTGRIYHHRPCHLDETDREWPSPYVCVWPRPAEVADVAELIQQRGLRRAVSIGCGEGVFERCLEMHGIHVTGVDQDALADTTKYAEMRCFLSEGIRRVRPDSLFEIEDASAIALCFIWGRNLPWRAYLHQYPITPLVVIAGEAASSPSESVATDPSANALDSEPEVWRCIHRGPVRAVHGGALLSVYERCNTMSLIRRISETRDDRVG